MSAELIAGLTAVAIMLMLVGYVVGYAVAMVRYSSEVTVTLELGKWWDEWGADVPED